MIFRSYTHNGRRTLGLAESDKIYLGGADKVICLGTENLDELVDHCLNNSTKTF